jgi:uncharacterized membrane protein YccC
LPQNIAALVTDIRTAKTDLVKARLSTASAVVSLLNKHSFALAALIRALEAKHGVVARSLELRAAEQALDAQKGEADAQTAMWNVTNGVYTPEVVTALKNYAAHLHDAGNRTREAIRGMVSELEGYGVGVEGEEGRERTMREMARIYREMGRQVEEARGDLDRLGRA